MLGIRARAFAASVATMAVLVTAGCSASVPKGGVLPEWPGTGESQNLTVVVPQNMSLPDAFVADVYQNSGVRLKWVSVDDRQLDSLLNGEPNDAEDEDMRSAAAYFGADSALAKKNDSAVKFGEDDICTLLDKAWYSANALSLPTGSDATPSPEGQVEASVMLVARGMNNTGTEGRWQLVDGTCSATERYLVPLAGTEVPPSFTKFSEYLESSEGQAAIGRYALAFPIGTRSGAAIQVQLPLAKSPVEVQRP